MPPRKITFAALAISLAPVPAVAQAPATAASTELMYQGWRGTQLVGQTVRAKADGRVVGRVRDLILDADGRAAALVVAGRGANAPSEALYRVPWSGVGLTPGQDGVEADLDGEASGYALFPGTEGVPTLPREFRMSELLGDYARLQSGYGFGMVTDGVFASDGRLAAVLVTRDGVAGGGTMAFPFPGTAGPWDPGMTYYGLPHATDAQAKAAGVPVDPSRFASKAL